MEKSRFLLSSLIGFRVGVNNNIEDDRPSVCCVLARLFLSPADHLSSSVSIRLASEPYFISKVNTGKFSSFLILI